MPGEGKKAVKFAPDTGGDEHVQHRPKVARHPEYSEKELRILGYVTGRFTYKLHKTLADELNKYTAKQQEAMLTVCKHGPFRWAASRGDVVSMKFIVDQMPDGGKSKLVEGILYKNNAAIRQFIEYCVNADIHTEPTKALLNDGLQIFIDIHAESAVSAIKEIAEEYDKEIREELLATLPDEAEPILPISLGCGGPIFFKPSRPDHFDPDDYDDHHDGGGSGGAGASMLGGHNQVLQSILAKYLPEYYTQARQNLVTIASPHSERSNPLNAKVKWIASAPFDRLRTGFTEPHNDALNVI